MLKYVQFEVGYIFIQPSLNASENKATGHSNIICRM